MDRGLASAASRKRLNSSSALKPAPPIRRARGLNIGFGRPDLLSLGAVYDNQVGMLINGVLSPNGFGLDNHTSSPGDSFDMGSVHAGDTLTFVLQNSTYLATGNPVGTGAYVYSDPSLNGPYDGFGLGAGGQLRVFDSIHRHRPIFDSITPGTYVGFEDLPAKFPPDYNYTDEEFVFTNVGATSNTPEPVVLASLVGLGAMGLVGYGWRRKKLKHRDDGTASKKGTNNALGPPLAAVAGVVGIFPGRRLSESPRPFCEGQHTRSARSEAEWPTLRAGEMLLWFV